MKNSLLAILLTAMCVTTSAMAQTPVASSQKVSSGTLESYPQFNSKFIPSRDVTVWLPDGYTLGEPCDVLYMHDGQMLFDATTTWNKQEWEVDEVMGKLIADGKVRRCIVVGIDNTSNRIKEYFPTQCYEKVPKEYSKDVDISQSKGDEYLQFLIEELKPFIDSHYKPLTSREHTFVMGSSMGGLISLYALCKYPQVFGGAICMSTHLSMNFHTPAFDNEAWATGFREFVKDNLPCANSCLLYMDRGTVELDGTYEPYQNLMDQMIRNLGWDDEHFVSRVFDGHKHMETFWAQRIDQPFMFILKP